METCLFSYSPSFKTGCQEVCTLQWMILLFQSLNLLLEQVNKVVKISCSAKFSSKFQYHSLFYFLYHSIVFFQYNSILHFQYPSIFYFLYHSIVFFQYNSILHFQYSSIFYSLYHSIVFSSITVFYISSITVLYITSITVLYISSVTVLDIYCITVLYISSITVLYISSITVIYISSITALYILYCIISHYSIFILQEEGQVKIPYPQGIFHIQRYESRRKIINSSTKFLQSESSVAYGRFFL